MLQKKAFPYSFLIPLFSSTCHYGIYRPKVFPFKITNRLLCGRFLLFGHFLLLVRI
nr:MAG TPA: hypothetical protein [Bacteriophage sp.]